jgi:glycosyltransferase involved in cell wall biosynthesis
MLHRAAALVGALLVALGVAPVRGAVSVFTNATRGLRAAQECADLQHWLEHLGDGNCDAISRHLCGILGFEDGEARCVEFAQASEEQQERVSEALKQAKRIGEKHAWNGTCAFTISAFNNWGVVRPFLESILEHNLHLPCLVWFVADSSHENDSVVEAIRGDFAALSRQFPRAAVSIASLDDMKTSIGYDAHELAFRYDLKCFSTAIKPHVFRMIFDRGYSKVVYFDPDIHFFSDLDEIILMLDKASFVLLPHITREYPDDGKWQTDLQIMRAGVYNFGFLGLSTAYPRALDHYLTWWADRLRFQGHVDLQRGMHFDQNWGVFIPSFYPPDTYKVLVDPRYNVAYWNLHYRGPHIRSDPMARNVTYAGAPLVFFHFSGVSTEKFGADTISPHQTRYTLSDLPNLQPLLFAYVKKASRVGYYRKHSPYGFDEFDNKAIIPFWIREVYNQLSASGRSSSTGPSYPAPRYIAAIKSLDSNPFATATENSFWRWLFEHRYDHIVNDETNEGWLPNIVLLTFQTFNIDPADFATERAARRWFVDYGALLATHAKKEEADALGVFVRSFVYNDHPQRALCCRLVGIGGCRSGGKSTRRKLAAKSSSLNSAKRKRRSGLGWSSKFASAKPRTRSHGRHKRLADQRHGMANRRKRRGNSPSSRNSIESAPPRGGRRTRVPAMCAHVDTAAQSTAAWRAPFVAANAAVLVGAPLSQPPFGVNVIGHINGVFGVAESSRYLYHGLKRQLPTAAIELLKSTTYTYVPHGIPTTRDSGYALNVVVQNADMSHDLRESYPWPEWRIRYNIGYWAYELEKLPSRFLEGALLYDEIWACSEFVAAAIRVTLAEDPVTRSIPVYAMPVGLPGNDDDVAARKRASDDKVRWGWRSDEFVFLVAYDVRSVPERKNPLGAVAAFQRAFAQHDESVRLVIKSHGGSPEQQAPVTSLVHGWPNIQLIDRSLDDDDLQSLKRSIDCYVSLHRSEGYGLNILEAILASTPVIATLYSGNMDFMRHLPASYQQNLGVAWKRQTLSRNYGPYPRGNHWSQPDIADAVRAMAYASKHRDLIADQAHRAVDTMRLLFSAHARGKVHARRLRQIQAERKESPRTAVPIASPYCYWLRYPDIRRVLGKDPRKLSNHFNKLGSREGRSDRCDWFSATIFHAVVRLGNDTYN